MNIGYIAKNYIGDDKLWWAKFTIVLKNYDKDKKKPFIHKKSVL